MVPLPGVYNAQLGFELRPHHIWISFWYAPLQQEVAELPSGSTISGECFILAPLQVVCPATRFWRWLCNAYRADGLLHAIGRSKMLNIFQTLDLRREGCMTSTGVCCSGLLIAEGRYDDSWRDAPPLLHFSIVVRSLPSGCSYGFKRSGYKKPQGASQSMELLWRGKREGVEIKMFLYAK